jgi:hypothetical protein
MGPTILGRNRPRRTTLSTFQNLNRTRFRRAVALIRILTRKLPSWIAGYHLNTSTYPLSVFAGLTLTHIATTILVFHH